MFRRYSHEKSARFCGEARPRDAIVIRGNRPPVHNTDGRNYKGGRQRTWVPVRRAGHEPVGKSGNYVASHGPELGGNQSDQGIEKSAGAKIPDTVES